MKLLLHHTPGIITFTDANTTIGYCRYNEEGEIEYIFVNGAHRRRGHARRLLALVEARLQRRLAFQPPLSPLGARLREGYDRQHTQALLEFATPRDAERRGPIPPPENASQSS
jgi:ribosomal protein S18 acetylase RimI-like enzyme